MRVDGQRRACGAGPRAPRSTLAATLLLALTCGAPSRAADTVPPAAVGPPLTALQTKLADPDWLVAWLLRPSRLRPGTRMPDFEFTVEEAQAAARYLYAGSTRDRSDLQWKGGDARIGKQLFVTRGCRGCHGSAPTEASVAPHVPNLADVGIKVRGDWLFDWLKAPRAYDPRSPMPQLALNDDDIRHLIAFLLTRRHGADVVAAAPRFNPTASPDAGRGVIERYECNTCHQVADAPAPRVFELTQANGRTADAALRDGRMLIAYFNCRGCHRIEGSGGAIAEYLERKTLAPPTLEGEGARVQTSWLVEYLQRPTSLRPWLKMRMPNYGFSRREAEALASYFAASAGVAAADEPVTPAPAEITERGLRRVAHFKCAQCHPSTPEPPAGVDPENLSINLMLARGRLRPSWIRDFLARPKQLVGTQTRMPTVFYSVDGVPKVEHPEQDIETVTAYLLHMTASLDTTLAALEQERKAEEKKEQIDWRRYEY